MTPDPTDTFDDLPELTPDARLREVSAIFASGIARLKSRSALASATVSTEIPEVIEKPLEEPG